MFDITMHGDGSYHFYHDGQLFHVCKQYIDDRDLIDRISMRKFAVSWHSSEYSYMHAVTGEVTEYTGEGRCNADYSDDAKRIIAVVVESIKQTGVKPVYRTYNIP